MRLTDRRFRNPILTMVRRLRYGAAIVVVSGLPRSGTSMLMRMLEAGGLPSMTDQIRMPDDDNPRGYFELERVKDLGKEADKSWVRCARGKAIKVISHLLKDLPADNFYRIILSQRDLGEVIASQNIMLRRRSEDNPVSDERTAKLYRKHLTEVKRLARLSPNMEMLEVGYHDTLTSPETCAGKIDQFLGGGLDIEKMVRAVDLQLHRNRRENLNLSRNTSS